MNNDYSLLIYNYRLIWKFYLLYIFLIYFMNCFLHFLFNYIYLNCIMYLRYVMKKILKLNH